MRKLVIGLALLTALLYGCGSLSEFTIPDNSPVTIKVTLIRASPAEIAYFCRGGRQAHPGAPIPACAFRSPDGAECSIYVPATTSELMVGHEYLQHCVLGIEH